MLDDQNPAQAWMRFKTAVIPFVGDDAWVEAALFKAKQVVQLNVCPAHSAGCEHKLFLDGVAQAI